MTSAALSADSALPAGIAPGDAGSSALNRKETPLADAPLDQGRSANSMPDPATRSFTVLESAKTVATPDGLLVVDYNSAGRAVGVEKTIDERMWASSGDPRFRAWLMALFGLIGLTLAAVGIDGVMAHSVAQRTREIGIRAALGAARAALLRMVLSESLGLAITGAAIGLALTLATAPLIRALLFAVSPSDSLVLIVVTSVLIAAGCSQHGCPHGALPESTPWWLCGRTERVK